MTGRIVQLARSPGGVPKLAIPEVHISTLGLDGDRQRYRLHGGPERAVSLFALEVIERLQAEGHPISPGSTGENVTIAGLAWPALVAGTRLALGAEVVVEITTPVVPCKVIRASFSDHGFKRIDAVRHPGEARLYARVLHEGVVRVGDPARVR